MSLNVLTAGEGRPLLLLHGFTGTARSWFPHIETLSQTRRVIAPDLLGHGGSDAPTGPDRYALERQAADLAALLGLLDATPATVMGYSMGARLALVLALEHPDVVDDLVLESPSAGIADPTRRAGRRAADGQLATDLERNGLETFVDRWEALPLFASHTTLPGDVRSQQRTERLRHDPRGLAASLRGAGQGAMQPLHDRLGTISMPALVLGGELDETGLERARVVADAIPDARLEVIGGAGHTPHLEQPRAFINLVTDHLTATPASHLP